MNIIVWLVVGGLIGWAVSSLMGTDSQQGLVFNVVVGVVGAFLGGSLLNGFVGSSTINQGDFIVTSVVMSLVGAIVLIGLLKVVRRE